MVEEEEMTAFLTTERGSNICVHRVGRKQVGTPTSFISMVELHRVILCQENVLNTRKWSQA